MSPSNLDPVLARRHVVILILLATGYISLFMVFRWLQAPLFDTFEVYWGRVQPVSETVYLIISACLPLMLWGAVLYAAWALVPRPIPAIIVAGIIWLALVFIEGDLVWYGLSHQHAGPSEVLLLLTSNVIGDWEVDPSSLRTIMVRMVKHAVAVIALWAVAGFLARRLTPRDSKVLLGLVPVLFLMLIIDSALVGYALSGENREWRQVAHQNPARVRLADRAFEDLFRSHDDLDQANAALTYLRQAPDSRVESQASSTADGAQRQPDILMIVVESLSLWYVDSATMPFWTTLSERSIRLEQHYSTGNATEYGILGLVFGRPVSFYRGMPFPATMQTGSPYIDQFIEHGYDTRVVSWEMVCYADIGAYLRNFNRRPFETRDDWELIPIISEELGRPGPQFVLSLYNGTHFPYRHQSKYTVFTPEIPDSFDYLTNQGIHHVDEVRNRYRNTLRELDDWLATLFRQIDLGQTVVVVTGDHGEELFEHGRLGHLSSLEEVQIRTPLLIHAPWVAPTTVASITSHADVMPSLVDLLGWQQESRGGGQSVFDSSRVPVGIVAHKRSIKPPNRWAVITPGAKSVVFGEVGQELRLRDLLDRNDQSVDYATLRLRWQDNFVQALRFERMALLEPSIDAGDRWKACD